MIDYETQEPQYEETPEDRAWKWRRIGYYFSHALLLALIASRVGPNLILFRSVFSPTPEHYVPFAHDYLPMIAAIKAYQRDTGQLPFGSFDLPQRYRPAGYKGQEGNIMGLSTITFPIPGHSVLEYDFRPASEGWIIYSPRYYGPLPTPAVQAAPTPTTKPASDEGSNAGN